MGDGLANLAFICSVDDFAGINNCVYQVRCNLFHGSKSTDGSRDKMLVKTSARIVEDWVSCLVATWQSGNVDQQVLIG